MKASSWRTQVLGAILLPFVVSTALAQEGAPTGGAAPAFSGLAQAPEANLFTGSASTSIPIDIPPGRKGITPQLALTYNSGVKHSPYGYGWDLPLGKVQRSSKHGVLSCTDPTYRNDFVIALPGAAIECTLDSSSGGTRTCAPMVNEAPVRILYFTATNSWEVTDLSGIKYLFGEQPAARTGSSVDDVLFGPSPQGWLAPCWYTASWGLTTVTDRNGNTLSISYRKHVEYGPGASVDTNILHPHRIEYGANASQGIAQATFVVEFEWEA